MECAADVHSMKAVPRSRLAGILTLALAIWSGAPSIRWCRVAWAFPECIAFCPSPCATPCSAGGAGCALGDPACAAEPDAPGECDAGPAESGERKLVFCVGGPMGGAGVRPVLADGLPNPAPALAEETTDLRVAPCPSQPGDALERERAPTPPRALRPPVRAPPIA
jgi:hypothetical protein